VFINNILHPTSSLFEVLNELWELELVFWAAEGGGRMGKMWPFCLPGRRATTRGSKWRL
jgi:hypothetical protein